MDRNGHTYREFLRSQVEEAYGRLTYSYTAQNKQADIDSRKSGVIKWLLLILSVVSTGSVMSLFLADTRAQLWVAVICSAALALLSAYSKSADLDGKAAAHKRAADSLWPLREEYISLLTDFDVLDDADLTKRRDRLSAKVAAAYRDAPKTSPAAYKKAQEALKTQEEQYFSREELNKMLPETLRR